MAAIDPLGAGRLFGRFLGNAISGAAGYALGEATADVLRPRLQNLKNEQNAANPLIPPAAGTMAQGVAQGQVSPDVAATFASHSGIGSDQFAAMVDVANTGPDLGAALTLLRRGVWLPELYTTALNRQAIEQEWWPGLTSLKDEWLTPSQTALGIVRSLIPDPGLMPVDLPTAGGVVPAYTKANIDAIVEAGGGGIDQERLRVLVGSIGLPMSTQQAANAYFRKQILLPDYYRSILEGDVRPEWADAILEQARAYPSVHDYIEDHLRGWSDEAAMLAGADKHGMSAADTQILFRTAGRPLSFHQVFIGLARGGTYDGPTAGIAQPFLKALQESNIRPEWYNLAWAQRYTYPAAFVLRALTQGGDVTQAESEQILLWEGWEPTLAAKVAAKWAGGTGAAATVKKETAAQLVQQYLLGVLTRDALTTALAGMGYTAQQATDLITAAELKATSAVRTKNTKIAEKQYVAVKTSEAQARQQLAELGWPANVIDNYIAAWNIERAIQVTTLTVAQIAAALKAGALLASQARPLLADLGEDANAIETIIATAGANAAT